MSTIFLSVPVHGQPELKMMYTMYNALISTKHKIRLYFNENDSLISRVRNVHISDFFFQYKECDYFVSLDSDLEIENCKKGDNIFDKLIEHNVEFVGGLYAIKKPGERRSSSITFSGKKAEYNTGLLEMRWLSTGCWCLKRSVVEKMVKAYPELMYDGDDNAAGRKVFGGYIPMLYDLKEGDFPGVKLPFRKYLSEDWSFAERWKAIGGKLFADTSIILKHIGKTDYTLFNKSDNVVQNSLNLPKPGFDLKMKKIK